MNEKKVLKLRILTMLSSPKITKIDKTLPKIVKPTLERIWQKREKKQQKTGVTFLSFKFDLNVTFVRNLYVKKKDGFGNFDDHYCIENCRVFTVLISTWCLLCFNQIGFCE